MIRSCDGVKGHENQAQFKLALSQSLVGHVAVHSAFERPWC